MKGIDAAQPVGSKAAEFVADGDTLFCRYYSHNDAKNLHHAEAQQISDAGGVIISVWEARGDEYESFTAEIGKSDADAAVGQARECGQPGGSAIYAAYDSDFSQEQIDGGIAAYAAAFKAGVTAAGYQAGVYGSPLVASSLSDKGLISLIWRAQSRGWRGDRSTHTDVSQGPEETLLGIDVDTDSTTEGAAQIGAWSLPASAAQSSPTSGGGDIEAAVKALQAALGGLVIDGAAGPLTIAALRRWQSGR